MSGSLPLFEVLSPYEIAQKAEFIMEEKAKKKPLLTFLLSLMAGCFIGIAFVFYTLVTTSGFESAPLHYGVNKLVGGVCFSLGLMLVIICGSELFTSTTMTVIAKSSKKITWTQMLTNWGVVYLGNFIGALILVMIIYLSKHYYDANGAVALNYLKIADHKLKHSFIEAVALGILCNIMVCLGVWLSYSGRTLTDKLLAVILPVAMFVSCGFEHCVANMFEIPMAIVIQLTAPFEFWEQIGKTANDFAHLTWRNFIINNLVPVTIGNIIGGGFFVGLLNWVIYLKPKVKNQIKNIDDNLIPVQRKI